MRRREYGGLASAEDKVEDDEDEIEVRYGVEEPDCVVDDSSLVKECVESRWGERREGVLK